MKYLSCVSSEGGPLVIADAQNVQSWQGSDGTGTDYESACLILNNDSGPGDILRVGQGGGVVWDLVGREQPIFAGGAGCLEIVRVWINGDDNKDDEEQTVLALAESPVNTVVTIGTLEITSGVVTILWAAESGACIQSLDVTGAMRPTGPTSTGGAAVLVQTPIGRYVCFHEEVTLEDGQGARRCHVIHQDVLKNYYAPSLNLELL